MNQATITRKLQAYFDAATPSQLEAGARWYDEAREVIQGFMVTEESAGGDRHVLETAVGVVAATSPRLHWSRNLRVSAMILNYPHVRPPGLLGRSYMAALAVMSKGASALSGAKVKSFYAAIMGDEEAIVVDVWMMRAAEMEKDSPNSTDRRMIEDGVRSIARRRMVSPRTVQATIWVVARGRS